VTGDRCAARRGRRAPRLGLYAALLGLAGGAAAAPETRCADARPAAVEVRLLTDAVDVARGGLLEVEARIVNTNGGVAELPLFRLRGGEQLFAVEQQESSYPDVAYARYRLRALQAGQAALWLVVNYATTDGCGDLPTMFRSARSRPQVIFVHDGPVPARPTPTPTPARTSATSPRR
jgi:hypothetical protein